MLRDVNVLGLIQANYTSAHQKRGRKETHFVNIRQPTIEGLL